MRKFVEIIKPIESVKRTASQVTSPTNTAAMANKTRVSAVTSGFYENSIQKPLVERIQNKFPGLKFMTPPKPVLPSSSKLHALVYRPRFLNTTTMPPPITKEYLDSLATTENSIPSLLPSLFVPMGFTQQKHFEGALAGSLIMCLKNKVPQEQAYLIAAFQFGSAGSNITILQTLSKVKLLKKNMDMLPYLPQLDKAPEIIVNKLANLPIHEFMFYYESITMLRVNQDLLVKLEFYQQKKPLENSLTVQNLTGNRCPDFVRNFQEPLGTIVQEAYDQKSFVSALQDSNHIRPVSGNLGEKANEAVAHLSLHVNQWLLTDKNDSRSVALNLSDALKNLKLAYETNKNSQIYASSYNQLRNTYGEFLINHRIPMNLVTEISLQQLPVESQHSSLYRQTFIKMCYSADSPWLKFANEQVQKSNSKSINYDAIIKAFAEYLSSHPN